MNDIEKNLYDYIGETYGIAGDEEYTPQVNMFDSGFLDSLGSVELITYIEETWGVEITQKDLMLYPMNSVCEIAAVISGKLG